MTDQPIKCVATVFLPVTDQDRSLAFFRDQLGFDVHSDTDYGEGIRWIEVVPPGAMTVIALNGPSDWAPGVKPGDRAPFSFHTNDLEAAIVTLSGRGVKVDDPVRMPPPVPSMAYLYDPDGNKMLLIQHDE
jgi:catechol 2,3-dioxygenase-like lactoylglutathione lyase family enzyme